jgi:hypothetical protein
MRPRKPVDFDGNMLRAIFTRKPQPSDTRSFVVRLLSSIRLVAKGTFQKGINFIGIKGGADF